jgi:hypothetical protein
MKIIVDFVALYMCPNSKLILAVLTPDFDEVILKPEPQYLFIINIETHEVKQVVSPYIPVRSVVPVVGNRFFLQDASVIVECSPVEDGDVYNLQKLSRGVQFNLGTTIISLVDCIIQEDTEYLILFKDKYFTNSHDKQIYVIDKKSGGLNVPNIESLLNRHMYTLLTNVKDSNHDIFSPLSQQRICACFDPTTNGLYAIVASQDFALLYKIKILPSALNNNVNTVCYFTQILPIKKACKIAVVNSSQLAVYSKLDLLVTNHNLETPASELGRSKVKLSELDFKIKFENPIQTVGISSNVLVIDYGPRSVLINVGEPADSEIKDQQELEQERIKTLNQLSAAYKRCLK